MDPKSMEAVRVLKNSNPKTIGDVRRLVGLLGYYRRKIPNFSRIAKPLYDLLNVPKIPKIANPDNTKKRSIRSGQLYLLRPLFNGLNNIKSHWKS